MRDPPLRLLASGCTKEWKLAHLLRCWCSSGFRLVGYMPPAKGHSCWAGRHAFSSTMNHWAWTFTKPRTVARGCRPQLASSRALLGSSPRGACGSSNFRWKTFTTILLFRTSVAVSKRVMYAGAKFRMSTSRRPAAPSPIEVTRWMKPSNSSALPWWLLTPSARSSTFWGLVVNTFISLKIQPNSSQVTALRQASSLRLWLEKFLEALLCLD